MTLIEAESAGTPVLFVDPDLAEVVPEKGSLLASGQSPTAVALALNEIYKNPEKIKQMSEAMLKHRDEVRVSKVVDKLEKYIKIDS